VWRNSAIRNSLPPISPQRAKESADPVGASNAIMALLWVQVAQKAGLL
jgi:hypothetical protein